MKSIVKKTVRKLLGTLPVFRGVYYRIDTARFERDAALRDLDTAQREVLALTAQLSNEQQKNGRLVSDLLMFKKVPIFVPPGHFYSPVVDPKNAATRLQRVREQQTNAPDFKLPGIDLDRDEIGATWNRLLPYLTSSPFSEHAQTGWRYYYENPAYSYGDGSVLHAMIRNLRPARMIEVGSGWSSACALDTVDHFLDGQCEFTFIEPYPELLKGLIGEKAVAGKNIRILEQRIQDVPLELFDSLEPGDILFIDSTHILATGSDVCFELFEVMPRIKPGVVVHFHDMFWPFEYPAAWAVDENRSWNELYGIQAFLTHNAEWHILFFNDFFAKAEPALIGRTFPLFMRNPGGALWLVKK